MQISPTSTMYYYVAKQNTVDREEAYFICYYATVVVPSIEHSSQSKMVAAAVFLISLLCKGSLFGYTPNPTYVHFCKVALLHNVVT